MNPRRQEKILTGTAASILIMALALVVILGVIISKLTDNHIEKTVSSTSTTEAKVEAEAEPAVNNQDWASAKYARLVTSLGDITIELYPEAAPKTVTNFITLANRGYYNNLIFHRVVKDFVVQGGDPNGNGSGGESIYGQTFEDEINSYKIEVGSVAMANHGANTNGSQFFIVTKNPQPSLDGKHTVFGQVIEGMEVVNKMNDLTVDPRNERPTEAVTIRTILTDNSIDGLVSQSNQLTAGSSNE